MNIKNKSILDYFDYKNGSKRSSSPQSEIDYDINCLVVVDKVERSEDDVKWNKRKGALSLDEIIKEDKEILSNVIQINKTLNKKHERVDKSKSISMLKEIKLTSKDVNCGLNNRQVFPVFIKPKQLERMLNEKERLNAEVFRCNTNYRKKNWK